MKKNFNLMSGLMVLTFALSGCNDSDDKQAAVNAEKVRSTELQGKLQAQSEKLTASEQQVGSLKEQLYESQNDAYQANQKVAGLDRKIALEQKKTRDERSNFLQERNTHAIFVRSNNSLASQFGFIENGAKRFVEATQKVMEEVLKLDKKDEIKKAYDTYMTAAKTRFVEIERFENFLKGQAKQNLESSGTRTSVNVANAVKRFETPFDQMKSLYNLHLAQVKTAVKLHLAAKVGMSEEEIAKLFGEEVAEEEEEQEEETTGGTEKEEKDAL